MLKSTIVLIILTVSSSVLANSFDRGLNYYRTANFVQAKVEFQSALRAGSNRSGYGKIYKYLGLSQYMLGETKEAKASFGYALHYDPGVELYPNEVLDSSVLEFFLSIKQKLKKARPSPPKRAKTSVVNRAKKKPVPVVKAPPVKAPSAKVVKPVKLPASKSKVGTSRKPRRVQAKNKPAAARPKTNKVASRSRSAANKGVQKKSPPKQARPKTVGRQTKQQKPAVAKNKKQLNMFSAKKPPKVIILDSSGNKVKKQPKKRVPAYQELLPVPSSKTSSVRVRGGISAWSFLPFGAGQYAAGRYKIGHLLAIASVGALVTSGAFYWAMTDSEGKLEQVTNGLAACKKRNACDNKALDKENLNKDGKPTETTVLKILTRSQGEIDNEIFLNKIGMWSGVGAFGALWVGGIVEAVVNRPSPISYVYFDRKSVALAFNYDL